MDRTFQFAPVVIPPRPYSPCWNHAWTARTKGAPVTLLIWTARSHSEGVQPLIWTVWSTLQPVVLRKWTAQLHFRTDCGSGMDRKVHV